MQLQLSSALEHHGGWTVQEEWEYARNLGACCPWQCCHILLPVLFYSLDSPSLTGLEANAVSERDRGRMLEEGRKNNVIKLQMQNWYTGIVMVLDGNTMVF